MATPPAGTGAPQSGIHLRTGLYRGPPQPPEPDGGQVRRALPLPLADAPEEALAALAHTCKHFELPVTGTCGFDQAQVTAGGLRTDEFDPHTLQSRLVPGLYACGEVLDVDGDCGGYNLQWAWSSGHLAGQLR